MSRSYKKNKVTWLCGSRRGQMKKWKTECNRRMRRQIPKEELPDGSRYKKFSGDIWASPSDGRYKDFDDSGSSNPLQRKIFKK